VPPSSRCAPEARVASSRREKVAGLFHVICKPVRANHCSLSNQSGSVVKSIPFDVRSEKRTMAIALWMWKCEPFVKLLKLAESLLF
jgi:hypothetical protein